MSLELPLDPFKKYFSLSCSKYDDLSETEKGIVLSLVKNYPDKFKSKSLVEKVSDIKPVTKESTPSTSSVKTKKVNKSTRKAMRRRYNMH